MKLVREIHHSDGPVVNRIGVILEAARPTPTTDLSEYRASLRTVVARWLGYEHFDMSVTPQGDALQIVIRHDPIYVGKRPRGSRGGKHQHLRSHPPAQVRAAA